MKEKVFYDVIVIGAGHAGSEAALASSRMGCSVLLLTLSNDNIGMLSCNPAIGGVGKGHLVKEIDALGGEMGKAADHAGIQFRQLNASKGAAARSSRAQIDRSRYKKFMQEVVLNQPGLEISYEAVTGLIVKNNIVYGVRTKNGKEILGKTVIITTGTFLNSLIHIGLTHFPGGRIDEDTVSELSVSLEELGFRLMRFKTGTCMRIDKNTIGFQKLDIQAGDKDPVPFSFRTQKLAQEQLPCYVTYTNEKTHDIIRRNLDRSPLYSGLIRSTGVRYCPSIEDKVMRFSDRTRHQVFLEPEGLDDIQYYPNGLSTSLPEDVQHDILHSIKGLENAKILKMGYGIEYDLIDPTELTVTLESKKIKSLYFAGQMNGTTGYEEAGAQGLIAGINAALNVKRKEPLVLDRSTSYIGILIDDLVTKGTAEPYRMFTSRVEYRLLLREDNADARLSGIGRTIGLLTKKEYDYIAGKQEKIRACIKALKETRIKSSASHIALFKQKGIGLQLKTDSVLAFLKMPHITLALLKETGLYAAEMDQELARRVETEVKYAGYIAKQIKEVKLFKNLEKIKLPADIDFFKVHGLSNEIREKLTKARPVSLGQASRISGVTPVAISILMVYLRK